MRDLLLIIIWRLQKCCTYKLKVGLGIFFGFTSLLCFMISAWIKAISSRHSNSFSLTVSITQTCLGSFVGRDTTLMFLRRLAVQKQFSESRHLHKAIISIYFLNGYYLNKLFDICELLTYCIVLMKMFTCTNQGCQIMNQIENQIGPSRLWIKSNWTFKTHKKLYN